MPGAEEQREAGTTLRSVALPVAFGVEPMLAKAVGDELPVGEGLVFEPKWDGFRLLVFKDGDQVRLQSRNLRPFERYVPELVSHLRDQLPDRCVLDGELVVITDGALDFDALQQRIHPAASRVQLLAGSNPASYVAFDALALGDDDLRQEPFARRRALLARMLDDARPPLHLTPATTDRSIARDWFVRFEGAGLDGLIAKPADGRYQPGKRAQFKVKHTRTADCVVAGYRVHKDGAGIGSLLLGIFDSSGRLHHVGVATSFTAHRRAELIGELAPLRLGDAELALHPWAGWQRAEGHRGQCAPAGRHQPVERRKGPVLRGTTTRSGGRGRLREPAQRAIPPLVPIPGMASRPRRKELHLRAVRGPRIRTGGSGPIRRLRSRLTRP